LGGKLRSKLSLILLIVFVQLTLYPVRGYSQNTGSWNHSYYREYDVDDFRSYGPANQILDFDNLDYPLLNAAIFYESNRMRIQNGVKSFIHSRALEEAAFLHAKDMAELNFFSHHNPYDGEKRTPFQRMALFGIDGGHRAENIAEMFGIQYEPGTQIMQPEKGAKVFRTYRTGTVIQNHTYISFSEALLRGWMKSPGHRANIMKENLKYLGCGAFHYEDASFFDIDQFKAVQNFASQAEGQ
jgi:uncharacterized protein YkwD